MTDVANAIADVLEQSLHAAAHAGEDITPRFFARFFARHPDQQAMFFLPATSCPAMAFEILDTLLALAAGESWVSGSIHNLVMAHRCYGAFPVALYGDALEIYVDALAEMAGERWTADYDAAWRRVAADLLALIAHAH